MGCSLTMWDVNSNNQRRFSCKEHELFFNYVGCKYITNAHIVTLVLLFFNYVGCKFLGAGTKIGKSFSCSLTMWDVNI